MDVTMASREESAVMMDDRADLRQNDNTALKLSDLVYTKISNKIRVGEYPIDTRLPTENELAEWLGVSRPVVREALARLRNDGAVVSRRGSGTYVQMVNKPSEQSYPPLTSISDMRHCLEYRVSLEGEAAYHAAKGKDEDRDLLRQAYAVFERETGTTVFNPETDFDFHLGIAIATGNRFFSETMTNLHSSIITAMSITPAFISSRSPERVGRIHAEHQAIYDAIIANDADGARNAMRNHLQHAMQRVFDGV